MTQTPRPTADAPRRCILVLTVPPDEREHEADREDEMRSLCDTAGLVVAAVARQHLNTPASATYIGKGKVAEVAELAQQHAADEIVLDAQLSPRQERNLEETLERLVVDYPALILHIFARGARSHQAQLAVELAQLEHLRSRLKRRWSHLDRIKGGTNMRGPGEKQLEVDKRLIRDRILDLRARLDEIEARKDRAIGARGDCFKVCLVGYTNAGKSSLMNALTHAGVYVEDRLFATLDTRTSRLHLGSARPVVISDTVGFIRDLPPHLIASFHATLAEAIEADLLLHVVDAAQPAMEEQIAVVEEVLDQIGAGTVPALMVFNKIDKPHSRTVLLAFKRRYKGSVMVSAKTGDGLDALKAAILEAAERTLGVVRVRFGAGDGKLDAFIRRSSQVLAEDFDGEQAILTVRAGAEVIEQLRAHPDAVVEPAEAPAT